MSEGPPNNPYQDKERLEERRDFARVAFGEESLRIDARAEVATNKTRLRQKEQDRQQDTFRFQIMVSRHYAALYGRVMQQIADTQANICAAIIKVQVQLQDAEQQLALVLDKANKLGGDTPVFQYEDGTIRTDTGRILGKQERDSLIWHDDMPSGADYERTRKQVDHVQNKLRTLQGYDTEVRGLTDKAEALENKDTPENNKALDSILGKLSGIDQGVNALTHERATISIKANEQLTIPIIPTGYSQ